ncbi:MAG: hypothetical protein ACYT04_60860, partial [Nostoc sp.]
MLEANIRDNQELSQLIQQANSKREAIALVQEGQPKAVLLSFAMFQHLIEISDSIRVASRREALRRNRREQLSNEGF